MKKVLCLLSSPPESAQLIWGLGMVREWQKKGHAVQIGLLQDGIYAGIKGSAIIEDNALPDAEWFVLADDLQLRGFSFRDLRDGVRTIDYPNLIKMMMEDTGQVLGAF